MPAQQGQVATRACGRALEGELEQRRYEESGYEDLAKHGHAFERENCLPSVPLSQSSSNINAYTPVRSELPNEVYHNHRKGAEERLEPFTPHVGAHILPVDIHDQATLSPLHLQARHGLERLDVGFSEKWSKIL